MTIRSIFTGTAFGAGAGLVHLALRRGFGDAPDAQAVLLVLAAAAFVSGLRANPRANPRAPHRSPRAPAPPSARTALLVLAGAAAFSAWIPRSLGGAVAALGGGLGAPAIGVALARAAVAAPILVPLGWVAGTLARRGLRLGGPAPARRAGLAAAGAALGLFAIALVAAFGPGGVPFAGAVAGIAIAVIGWLGALSSKAEREADAANARHPGHEPAAGGGTTPAALPLRTALLALARGPALPAFATALAALAWLTLAPRLAAIAEGNDFSGIPFAGLALLGGCALGAAAAASFPIPAGMRPAALAGAAIAAGAILVLLRWPAYDRLVPSFAEWTAAPLSFGSIAANAARSIVLLVAPVGALLGLAFGALARDVPEERAERIPWLATLAAAAVAGVVAGWVLVGRALPQSHLEGGIAWTAFAAGLAAAAGIAFAGRVTLVRSLAGLGAGCAILAAMRATPAPDRSALKIDRHLIPASALADQAQKNWLVFDEDGRTASFSVVRRGHARRLLVDGRYEASNESVKSHGFLAHLPLLLHSSPRRVIVLGSGNGIALDAALSHPVEIVECLETDRAPVRATAQLGPHAERSLLDPRLALRLGDPQDLLARARPADAILSQVSGVWNDRAAAVSTREFLELAARRLDDGGFYCQWVPDSALTKEGLLTLLATFASVFPQVEVWGGQGGDVLILARESKTSIDAARLVERFRSGDGAESAEASWVEEPISFLSNFLASDATVRRLAAGSRSHSIRSPRLGLEETARRRGVKPVNPVPGLAALGDDVTRTMVGSLGPEFDEAVRRGVEARALERDGVALEIEGRAYDAIEAYERALERSPSDGSVRRSLATLRTRMGIRYVQDSAFMAAHNNLRSAVEIDTTYAQGFANLGALLAFTGPPDYALSATHQALQLEPDDDLSWTQMGAIRRREGKFAEAIPYFEGALRINPRNVDAALGYADAKLESAETPDVGEAIAYLERFLALEPENATLRGRIDRYRDALNRRVMPESPEGAEGFSPPPGFLDPGSSSAGMDAPVGLPVPKPR